ncbi:MAG: hypothetical protein AAGG72_07645 [Pseudomonadota bacterium]
MIDGSHAATTEQQTMKLDTIILVLAALAGLAYAAAMLAGIISLLPYGLPLLVLFAIFAYIIYRIIHERLTNEEDKFYERNIEK